VGLRAGLLPLDLEQCLDDVVKMAMLSLVRVGELRQHSLPAGGKAHQHLSCIIGGRKALNQIHPFHAIDETDAGVVTDLQRLRQFANRGVARTVVSANGKQELMLLRGNTGGASRFFAKPQKFPQACSKRSNRAVIVIRKSILRHIVVNGCWHCHTEEYVTSSRHGIGGLGAKRPNGQNAVATDWRCAPEPGTEVTGLTGRSLLGD